MIRPQTVEKEREESRTVLPLPKRHREFGGWGPRIG
jgi:hypothetical protein